MMTDLASLWQPLDIGGTRVKNRVMTTAHSLAYGLDGTLSDRHIAYYRERAKGGIGLLISEQHAAHELSRGSFYNCLTAWEERCIPQMAKLADAVHDYDCRFFVELFTTGVQDKGWMFPPWHELWGPSRVPSVVHNEIPKIIEQDDIDSLVAGYAKSAANVKASGLDGVELHGAHSYGIAQFLSPYYNRRTDRYGGSVRKRCQFALEVAAAVRDAVGPDFPLGIRLSFDEFAGESGITGEQTEEQLELLASSGLFDFFDISGGNYQNLHMAVATMAIPDGYMIPFGKRAKDVVGDRAKVFIVGRIRRIEMAAKVIDEGSADMVAMTRAHITDPHVVKKALEGRSEDIHVCVGANECILRNFQQLDVACMMNPVTGRETEWGELSMVTPAEVRRIAVVGGGPAGMKAAAVAARRGHEVVLIEQCEELGGHLNLIKQLPTRASWQDAIDNLSRELANADVDIRLGVEATPSLLEAEAYDVVICATGSQWDCTGFSTARSDRDTIPGVDQDNVIDVGSAIRSALAEPGCLGSRVLVVDDTGEYLPLGLAELLANDGTIVEVISPRQVVGENVFGALEAGHLMPRLAEAKVMTRGQWFLERIDGRRCELYSVWGGEHTVKEFDTVVLSLMRTSCDELYWGIRDKLEKVHRIGDAVAPRRTTLAIYEGERIGRRI